jgi:hypothetical protein
MEVKRERDFNNRLVETISKKKKYDLETQTFQKEDYKEEKVINENFSLENSYYNDENSFEINNESKFYY